MPRGIAVGLGFCDGAQVVKNVRDDEIDLGRGEGKSEGGGIGPARAGDERPSSRGVIGEASPRRDDQPRDSIAPDSSEVYRCTLSEGRGWGNSGAH